MPNYCVAFGCSNTSSKPGISCFRFPKDPVLKKKWIEQVRDKWPEGPSKNSVVCSEHFTQDCFDASSQLFQSFGMKKTPKLKNNSIPTIFNRPNSGRVTKRRTAYHKRQHLRVNVTIIYMCVIKFVYNGFYKKLYQKVLKLMMMDCFLAMMSQEQWKRTSKRTRLK